MIPKKIHYCWFGKQPMSKTIQKCIASWKQHLPDFEIILWDESNSDLNHPFVKKAIADKKWAFVSDYVRLQALKKQGGVYLDTDMLVLKHFSELLKYKCFVGLENEHYISCGVIGSTKMHPYISKCLEFYDKFNYTEPLDYKAFIIPKIFTSTFKELYNTNQLHLKDYNDICVFDKDYFYPYPNPNPNKRKGPNDYQQFLTKQTYAVHLWERSWTGYSEFQLIRQKRYCKAIKVILNNGNQKGLDKKKYFRKLLSTIKTSIFG